jgi:hypothetical protein
MSSKQFIQDSKSDLFKQKVKSDYNCPSCGGGLDYYLQGFVVEGEFPEIARVLVCCEKCKTQVTNNNLRKFY